MSAPFYDRHGVTVHAGDCLDILATMADASVDAVVCDPPYGLEFMGKDWDRPWAVGMGTTGYNDGAERLARPAFGDSRNANCRTCKGRQRGDKRCICVTPDWDRHPREDMRAFQQWCETWAVECLRVLKPGGHLVAFGGSRTYHRLTAGIEDAGFEIRDSMFWVYGSGFPKGRNQLKPAHEPIVMARKPLAGTVAANVLAHGTGGLNVDACRVATDEVITNHARGSVSAVSKGIYGDSIAQATHQTAGQTAGRWPANVLFSHGEACADECTPGCPVAELDAQSGSLTSGLFKPEHVDNGKAAGTLGAMSGRERATATYGDTGGASRFFPVFRWEAKAPTAERPQVDGIAHPTVKPLDLMRWLVRLVTPPGGLVLDPFAGSGTTLHAARAEGFRAIGIEREPSYLPLIKARLDARPRSATAPTVPVPDGEPMDLLDLLGDAS